MRLRFVKKIRERKRQRQRDAEKERHRETPQFLHEAITPVPTHKQYIYITNNIDKKLLFHIMTKGTYTLIYLLVRIQIFTYNRQDTDLVYSECQHS